MHNSHTYFLRERLNLQLVSSIVCNKIVSLSAISGGCLSVRDRRPDRQRIGALPWQIQFRWQLACKGPGGWRDRLALPFPSCMLRENIFSSHLCTWIGKQINLSTSPSSAWKVLTFEKMEDKKPIIGRIFGFDVSSPPELGSQPRHSRVRTEPDVTPKAE